MRESTTIMVGDCREVLKTLPDDSVHCVVTSPPYWGLRDYGTAEWEGGDPYCDHIKTVARHDGGRVNKNGFHGSAKPDSDKGKIQFKSSCGLCAAIRKDQQIGLEPTLDEHIEVIVGVFREVKRVLRKDGTCWMNYGDCYAASQNGRSAADVKAVGNDDRSFRDKPFSTVGGVLKPKDLCLMPHRVAIALQEDGWWVRSDIVWCLSGGTLVYAHTQKGAMPMTIKDMARLDPATVKLWNGERWTQLLGVSKSARSGNEIELVLRSGERVSCTPTHRFPTGRGLLEAGDIVVGDCLTSCRLPQPALTKDCAIDEDAAWFAGLYVAEGSRSDDTIQISGHAKESGRWNRVQSIAAKYGGTATQTTQGNNQSIRVHGKILNAIIDELVTGKTAKTKGFAPVVWRYSDDFIAAMVDGYLSGDGCEVGSRWRLGFCRNYNLERGLRTACARLGYTLTLNLSSVTYDGRKVPTFRGELRKNRNGHWNEKDRNEVIEIRKASCRWVYELGVEDEPHLFALASGVLTHNSKPNPMPESIRDRPTRSHEYVFLLTRSERYFYDGDAVREPHKEPERSTGRIEDRGTKNVDAGLSARGLDGLTPRSYNPNGRNRRTVWEIAPEPMRDAHFATFPTALVKPCIMAGTSERGCCATCGAPWARDVARGSMVLKRSERTHAKGRTRASGTMVSPATSQTTGWSPTCECADAGDPVPCVVLDPFGGSGTVGRVAADLGRASILIELNPAYVKIAEKRTSQKTLMI